MLTKVIRLNGKSRDQAEKPFWISYADLMTALMVLFLVVMSVALLAVTKTITDQEKAKQAYDRDVQQLMDEVEAVAARFPDITLDRNRQVIDFGPRAKFDYKKFELPLGYDRRLREFVPDILTIANSELGRRILKRVVIEGFTDQAGTYLYNSYLSLQRSEKVLCALLAAPEPDELALSAEQRIDIQNLFLVSGFSYNAAQSTAEASRRVELRLELYGYGEKPPVNPARSTEDPGICQVR